jgi:hypothetical protein
MSAKAREALLPVLYFAGKVGGSADWRCQILGKHTPVTAAFRDGTVVEVGYGGYRDEDYDHYKNFKLPVLHAEAYEKHARRTRSLGWPVITFEDGFAYSGPYYRDLWGGHGVENGSSEGIVHATDAGRLEDYQREVVRVMCLEGVRKATHVFAWLDSPDAYGTLYELGVAAERGVPVLAALSRNGRDWGIEEDFWFALGASNVTRLGAFEDPETAFAVALSMIAHPPPLGRAA